ncbi:MAG: hypothetical protein KDA89_01850, partial [Planctomycetaceae bacterium]|nr:hypothetical protein [Planctomycetaceae bacterium]
MLVATLQTDRTAHDRVEECLAGTEIEHVSLPSESVLVAGNEQMRPQIFAATLGPQSHGCLQLQHHLRQTDEPLCFVYLDDDAPKEAVVRAMALNAVTILSHQCTTADLKSALDVAAAVHQRRERWISQIRTAQQLLQQLPCRQRDVMTMVVSGWT